MQDGEVERNRRATIIARNDVTADDPRPTPMRYINKTPMTVFNRINLKEQGGDGFGNTLNPPNATYVRAKHAAMNNTH